MTDLSLTIAPRSDQLNSDDLISGPKTITITKVRGCSEPDQPVAIEFQGDDGKPYRPCKSMRRVFVFAWGKNGNDYVGRSVTLYRDEKVMFGGIAVGGIRISHLSHIDRDMTMALTTTRAKRAPYTVKPLKAEVVQKSRPPARDADLSLDSDPDPAADGWDAKAWAQGQRENAESIDDLERLLAWWNELYEGEDFQRLRDADEPEAFALKAHVVRHKKALEGA
jgi:hypothetical protein